MSEKIPEESKYNEAEVEEYRKRFSALRISMSQGDDDKYFDFETVIANKGEEIISKYGKDRDGYSMWHVFAGSTIDGPIIAQDFPGEDSLAKFIEELEQEYGK